jgi:hypothetical protein
MVEVSAAWRVGAKRVGAWLEEGRGSLPSGASPAATIVRDRSLRRSTDLVPMVLFIVLAFALFSGLGVALGLVVLFTVGIAWWAFTDRRIERGRLVLDQHRLWVATSGRWLGPIDLRSVVAIDRGRSWWPLYLGHPMLMFVPKATGAPGVRARPSSQLRTELGSGQDVRALRIFGSSQVLAGIAVVALQAAPSAVTSTELSARLGIVPGAPPPPW